MGEPQWTPSRVHHWSSTWEAQCAFSQIDLGSYTNRFAVSTRLPDCEPLRAHRSRLDPLSIGERSTLDDGHVSFPNPLACGHEPPRAHGAFMEPSGRNRWQPVANGRDGKEGVNGSSPLEGFTKLLLFSSFSSRTRRRLGAPASTERPPLAATAFCGAWNRCC